MHPWPVGGFQDQGQEQQKEEKVERFHIDRADVLFMTCPTEETDIHILNNLKLLHCFHMHSYSFTMVLTNA